MTHTTQWPEERVLGYFWHMVREGADRGDLLRQLSKVAIARPRDWDRHAVRDAMAGVYRTMTLHQCFVCLNTERRLYWHHVIHVEHGGSSAPANLVGICHECHRSIHPWLAPPTSMENKRGWTSVRDIAVYTLGKMAAAWEARKAYAPANNGRVKVLDDDPEPSV